MAHYLLVQSPTDLNWHLEMPALAMTGEGTPDAVSCFRLAEAERLYRQVRIIESGAAADGGSVVTYERKGQGEWKRGS